MEEQEEKWIIGLVVALAVGVIYGLWVYSSILGERHGYVYDPKTDRIFEVTVGQDDPVSKKDELNPFKKTTYHRIKDVRYLGDMRELLRRAEEEKKLDAIEWEKQFEKYMAEWNDSLKSGSSWDMVEYRRDDLSVGELLPGEMRTVRDIIMKGKGEGEACEIVATHYYDWEFRDMLRDETSTPSGEERSPLKVEVIEKGVFIVGESAVYEMQRLLGTAL